MLYQHESGTSTTYQDNKYTTPIPSAFLSSSWESSDWAIHVAISANDAPIKVVDAIAEALKNHHHSNDMVPGSTGLYSAEELLDLGSAWYLPSDDMGNQYKKPSRLTTEQSDMDLREGDYLRIHHDPRRFRVELYEWNLLSQKRDNNTLSSTIKQPVLVEYNAGKGFLVLNKPADCISVHPTVDNFKENIASCLLRNNPELVYVTTPQRLDQNSSGLITLATSKMFASYYAKLLRHKTASEVDGEPTSVADTNSTYTTSTITSDTGIHKSYKCLLCLMPPPTSDSATTTATATTADDDTSSSWSVDKALQALQMYAQDGHILRHYLEPSVRAPKRFVATLPSEAKITTNLTNSDKAGWAECLLRIRHVGDVCALRGNAASEALVRALWNSTQEAMPPTCQAVVELEVELLTGRTHQIRGQLSASGFPLVGDMQYGGAVPARGASTAKHSGKYDAKLALQCSRLEFLDPDVRTVEKTKKGRIYEQTDMIPSARWQTFQLEEAWWTPILRQYEQEMQQVSEDETSAALDIGLVDGRPRKKKKAALFVELNPKGLPPQASLSPGRNKYVLVKAIDPNTGSIHKWFVKSASPSECGGHYHRNVAEDLVEWIEACGYEAIVTGGGRILYQDETKRALVYGFSYGFGVGDHARAASVIKAWNNEMDAAYDDSPDLY